MAAVKRYKCFGACNFNNTDYCDNPDKGKCVHFADCSLITPVLNKGYDQEAEEDEGKNEASFCYADASDSKKKTIEDHIEKLKAKAAKKPSGVSRGGEEEAPTKPKRGRPKKKPEPAPEPEPKEEDDDIDITAELDGVEEAGKEAKEVASNPDSELDDLLEDDDAPESKEEAVEVSPEEPEEQAQESVDEAVEEVIEDKAPPSDLKSLGIKPDEMKAVEYLIEVAAKKFAQAFADEFAAKRRSIKPADPVEDDEPALPKPKKAGKPKRGAPRGRRKGTAKAKTTTKKKTAKRGRKRGK